MRGNALDSKDERYWCLDCGEYSIQRWNPFHTEMKLLFCSVCRDIVKLVLVQGNDGMTYIKGTCKNTYAGVYTPVSP